MYEDLRQAVYAANMELYHRNLVLYTWGNVSQVDRDKGVFGIKPSGVAYEALKPEDIVIVSLENGKRVDGTLNPSSDTPTHLGLYRAFREIGGVTHTHSTCATSFAQAGREIPCLGTTHADYIAGSVPVTRFLTEAEVAQDYEGETATVIVEAFQSRNPVHTPAVLVRGHGPFTWGKDAAASVYNAVVLEEVARMAMYTFSLNPDTAALPFHVQNKHFSRKHGPNAYYGQK